MTASARRSGPLLEIEDLRIEFGSAGDPSVAVARADLSIAAGEIVGIVGESGSGKSLTCRAAMRLLPAGGRVGAGAIRFEGRDVLGMSESNLRRYRSGQVGMIFQDPFSSLNPVQRVGAQLAETVRLRRGGDRRSAMREAVDLLEQVGIPDAPRRARAYPHELSGGMRQRVMIALATASEPRLLIADEPTTALDVTTQQQILELIGSLRERRGTSVLLVSHDFGVIAQMCDRVVVMYGGHVVESAPIEEIFARPRHPYTQALMDAVPSLEPLPPGTRRAGIAGSPPDPRRRPAGCVFEPRCARREPECAHWQMEPIDLGPVHRTACRLETGSAGGGEQERAS
ncbi:ABC transporter ATP-binding protein [Nocardioides mangrovicus]|uniref:ABC transporter ATP-binding protein n=1 Tax=Nocardioides mangrovicus TaxID=2478913 RepID=UPI001314AEE0|nr:ABC transporter ATP-binding protein [Nocardioides mangrovicus]